MKNNRMKSQRFCKYLGILLLAGIMLVGCGKKKDDFDWDAYYAEEAKKHEELPRSQWKYSLNCEEGTLEKSYEYNVTFTEADHAEFFMNFVDRITTREPFEYDVYGYSYREKGSFTIEKNEYNHSIYKVNYIQVTADNEVGMVSVPVLSCIIEGSGESAEYKLTDEEFDQFYNHAFTECNLLDADCYVTYKTRTEDYYDITDKNPKGDILLVEYYKNYAWGATFEGYFVDTFGNIYEFDLSKHDFGRECNDVKQSGVADYTVEDTIVDTLYYEVYYKNAPVGQMDMSALNALISGVDRQASWKNKRSRMNDAGTSHTCLLENRKFLEISLQGDEQGYLNDKGAKKLVKYLKNTDRHKAVFDPTELEKP